VFCGEYSIEDDDMLTLSDGAYELGLGKSPSPLLPPAALYPGGPPCCMVAANGIVRGGNW
jgi:hypothetical protein